jgi:hypothetical protein
MVGSGEETIGFLYRACINQDSVCHEWDCFGLPLIQLKASEAGEETQQAIADWHHWVNQGYEFGYSLPGYRRYFFKRGAGVEPVAGGNAHTPLLNQNLWAGAVKDECPVRKF